ncbi:hypothetical protein [Costertonia aggregata]|uniref:Uncharacterized protein n=1 Tax=Costertonia aggregata TaxID=343403 RepID=A0A7H9ATU1_9FLAO|nr:hypothetical protein [Costertonia aggregata]QLG46860.1 hypothetical protein HYG79_16370 [Costertonia aggregata]
MKKKINPNWVNKYFRVRYSSKDPEINEILLDQWVSDTVEIEAAGFEIRAKRHSKE